MLKTISYLILSFLISAVAPSGMKNTYNDLIEKTITIHRSCIKSEPRDVLLLAGDCKEFLQHSTYYNSPVALIGESKYSNFDTFTMTKYSFEFYQKYNFPHREKSNRFIVVASSQPSLRLLLQRIKDSTWGNSVGFHVLIDRETEKRGCINAYQFLWSAWQYDLLSCVFLCIDPTDGLQLFTYNPYSDRVPDVWQNAGQFKGRAGHPWTLLKRKYRTDSEVCRELDFDKTVNLNGYQVRLNGVTMLPHVEIDLNRPGLEKFQGDNSEIIKIVIDKLNASVHVKVYNGSPYEVGGITPHGTIMGLLSDVVNGKVDMSINARPLHIMWRISYTYPHIKTGLCVITQRADPVSELSKILSYMSPGVTLAISAVILITLSVFSGRIGFFPASLNIIRLVTCVSMLGIPRDVSIRIFLANVMIVFLIINSLFQSHWASLLTLPVLQPNIETHGDLKKSGFTIYGSRFVEHMIIDPLLHSRFHAVSYDECKQRVLDSSQAACVDDCHHLYQRIRNDDLHRSKRIRKILNVFATRQNWPPFRRVNSLIQRIFESGMPVTLRRRNVRNARFARKRKRARENRSFRVLKLHHLTFSFYLIGIGYTFASIVLISELVIGRYRVRTIGHRG